MKRKFYFSVALLVFASDVMYSQSGTTKEQITLVKVTWGYSGNHHSTQYFAYEFQVGNGEFKNVGGTGKALRPYLLSYPEALKELDIFKRKKMISFVGGGAGVIGGALFLYGFSHPPDRTTNSAPTTGISSESPLLIVGGIMLLSGFSVKFYLKNNANKHLIKSIDEYNKSVASSLLLRIKPDNFGMFIDRKNNFNHTLFINLAWNINRR